MKIDISSIDKTQFHVAEHIWNGELIYLVTPQMMGCAWNKDNVIFRSSVWNLNGELISAGMKKFVNWGEKPDVFPLPTSLKNTTIMEKLDGSLLCVSKYKGEFMIRTRGTIDASKMEKNGREIEVFKNEVLPKLFKSHLVSGNPDTWDYSFLFEWTSDLNKIVLSYGDVPQFFLIGIVWHGEYRLLTQGELDNYAWELGLKRPETFTFDSIENLIASIEKWEGKEGVCLYHNGGQEIKKIKAAKYLMLHHMKSDLSSMEKILDIWISQGYPTYQDFYNYIATTFDYELAEQIRSNISKICDGYKEVFCIIAHMKSFVEPLKKLPRKDAAMKILSAYGETNRKSFCFNLLDNRKLDGESIKKLIFQVLKK